jgi:hypothetical protein
MINLLPLSNGSAFVYFINSNGAASALCQTAAASVQSDNTHTLAFTSICQLSSYDNSYYFRRVHKIAKNES